MRSWCLVRGRALAKPSVWGRPFNPLSLEGGGSAFKGWGQRPRSYPALCQHEHACTHPRYEERRPSGQYTDLLCLIFDVPAPLFLTESLVLNRYLLFGGLPGLEGRQHLPCLLCTRQKKVRSEPRKKDTRGGTLSTLRIVLQDEKDSDGKEEVIYEVRQFGDLIERLPIT
ncbi:hypothetical protein Cgig2_007166 [Carnegiea gigantea]|uniref:Uncharacterized protein n=1 Tax=Carnegiea gigantea TaxID=171969 RepID=A0A9Q1JSB6_9CARY|nr:hypothetical protein Cgig2_007166 [Carnegiea gigantea]